MYRKFILPLLISLVSMGAWAQTTETAPKKETEKIRVVQNGTTTTVTIANLAEVLKNIENLNFSDSAFGFQDVEMAVDTPPDDSLETIEITTLESDSGDLVEIIIKDKTGAVKKIVRINEDMLDDYRFDLGNRDILRRKSKDDPKPAKRNKNFETDWFAFDIGMNGLMHNGSASLPPSLSNLELDPWRSLHVNVGVFQQKINLYKHYFNFVYGINYDNNDYRFSNDINFSVDSTGSAIQFPSRNTVGFDRNKLTTRFLSIPVAFRINFNPNKTRSGHITFGVHGGYRLTSFFKTVRYDEGKRKNKVYDDFLLNNFRYGAFVKVGYGGLTLFGNYVFTPLFRENAGPELYPFSFGLSIGGF